MSSLLWLCLFTCGGVQHMLCFCFVCLRLVCLVLPVSLDCPFLFAPSVFSDLYSSLSYYGSWLIKGIALYNILVHYWPGKKPMSIIYLLIGLVCFWSFDFQEYTSLYRSNYSQKNHGLDIMSCLDWLKEYVRLMWHEKSMKSHNILHRKYQLLLRPAIKIPLNGLILDSCVIN